MHMIGRFLEDFAVGQTFRSGRVRIDTERIKTFGAEFDPQPFHLDEEAARDTIFRGLAASGWHTAARSEEHTSELQSQSNLVCRLLLEKKKRRARCTHRE